MKCRLVVFISRLTETKQSHPILFDFVHTCSVETGMGAGFIPDVLDLSYIDKVVAVHSDDAMSTTNELWMMGLPTGVSSGAIVSGAVQALKENPNKTAVCIIPSFGERYFTHPMFESIKEQATGLTKQPLPEPFDNTEFGFATPRG